MAIGCSVSFTGLQMMEPGDQVSVGSWDGEVGCPFRQVICMDGGSRSASLAKQHGTSIHVPGTATATYMYSIMRQVVKIVITTFEN